MSEEGTQRATAQRQPEEINAPAEVLCCFVLERAVLGRTGNGSGAVGLFKMHVPGFWPIAPSSPTAACRRMLGWRFCTDLRGTPVWG